MVNKRRQYILAIIILIIALGFGMTIGAITWIIKDTPDISNYKGTSEATLVYSADGQLLTKLFRQNRIYVPLERIPKDIQNAILAIEDTSFYVHHGIDFWGIARAFVTNIIKGERAQGASTITQQLARNALELSFEKTYYRKIQEAYLALQFERLYTKPEILEMYLNEIYLGDINHNAYGVEAASLLYFNKHVWELNLSESALISGLPKGSNLYSPLRNYEAAIKRRDVVLNRMLELGYITEEKANQAKNQEIIIESARTAKDEIAPYFILYIRKQLIDRFGPQLVYSGGLRVYTTLDIEMQKKAERAIENALEEKYIPTIEKSKSADTKQPQMALITIDPKNGAIRAMVGGRGQDQFNRAVQAVRQPGSAFKPFVYTTAIKKGYSPGLVLNDMPMLAKEKKGEPVKLWPTNFEDKYRGYVTLRTALNQSINVIAVKLIQEIGVQETIKTAEEMGISTFETEDKSSDHLSLALGGLNKGVTPLEMASAYGVLANRGIRVDPIAITRVLDKRNQVIYEAHPEKKIILPEDVSYLITDMLQTVISNGTGWRAKLDRPVAGKTGTTNNYTDAWFVGFTPDLVTSVWIGEDSLSPMEYNQKDEKGNYLFSENGQGRIVSSSEAARLWGNYMREVVKDLPVTDFHIPNNIVSVKIDPVTGLLPNQYTPETIIEKFRRGNQPDKVDNLHEPIATARVDQESWLLATDNCPEENIIELKHLKNSLIRVGPGNFSFGQDSKDTDIKGIYIVDPGEPIQKIDPDTGVPQKDKKGQIIYEKIPTEKCNLHGEPESDNLIDSLLNMFKDNLQ